MLSQFFKNGQAIGKAVLPPRRPYDRLSLAAHLTGPGPKRILAFDGGAVRTALTLGILEQVEAALAARHDGYPGFALSDYFDLIGGNSSGALVATALTTDFPRVADTLELYRRLVPDLFRKSALGAARLDQRRMTGALTDVFGKRTLSDGRVRTGLAILAQRMDTSGHVAFHNHEGVETDRGLPPASEIRLVGAITAAFGQPGRQAPASAALTGGAEPYASLFVDPALTPYSHAGLRLFMLATTEGRGFGWARGKDALQITAIGSGRLDAETSEGEPLRVRHSAAGRPLLADGGTDPGEQMVRDLNAGTARSLSRLAEMDRGYQTACTVGPAFAHVALQAPIDRRQMAKALGLNLSEKAVLKLQNALDKDGFEVALDVGRAAGEKLVSKTLFDEAFDLAPTAASQRMAALEAARPEPMTRAAAAPAQTGRLGVANRLMPPRTRALSPSVRRPYR